MIAGWEFFGAALLYLCAQVLRLIRIAFLCLDDRALLNRLIIVHLMTLLPGTLIPFKGGEILRLSGFVLASSTRWSGGLVWAIERTLDAATLVFLLICLALVGPSDPGMRILIAALLVFAFGAVSTALALRELAPFLHSDLLLRSRTRHGLVVLRSVLGLRKMIARAGAMLRGRISLLILLSSVIWSLELGSIALILDGSTTIVEIGPALSDALVSGGANAGLKVWMLFGLTGVGVVAVAIWAVFRKRDYRNV